MKSSDDKQEVQNTPILYRGHRERGERKSDLRVSVRRVYLAIRLSSVVSHAQRIGVLYKWCENKGSKAMERLYPH